MKIMASGPITSWQIDGETMETVTDFIFLGSKITADGDCSHEIKTCLVLGRKAMTNLDRILKRRDYFANKGPSSQGYAFSSGHVWMWELDCEEGWAPKNWCFWTVVLEKTLGSPLDCKEIQPVLNINWNDWCWSWNSSTLAIWCKELTHWNDFDAGKDWRQDEMVGRHHQLNGHEFEWTPGVGDGQGGLACASVHGVVKSQIRLSD